MAMNSTKRFTPGKSKQQIEGVTIVDEKETQEATEDRLCPEGSDIVYDKDGAYSDLLDSTTEQGESDEEKSFSCSCSDETDSITFNEDVKEKAPVKHSYVRTNCNHRCCYGGEWYDFTKGVRVSVPDELKATLLKAGLLMPL